MPSRLSSMVLYMSSNKSTAVAMKRKVKLARTEQLWSYHILHPHAAIDGFVRPSRGILF